MSNRKSLKKIATDVIAAELGIPKTKAVKVAEELVSVTIAQLRNDAEVVIGNIGKLFQKKYEKGVRYDPYSRKQVERAPYKTIRFKAFTGAKIRL